MSDKQKTILILYSELAQYLLSCVNELADYRNIDIHLIRWQTNTQAPFQFNSASGIRIYERKDFDPESLLALAEKLQPDLILCSGWMDKGYLKVCKAFKDQVPVLVGMDNQWTGGVRQQIASLVGSWTVQRWFTHAWVAGESQKKFARKLGFKEENILEGIYSADTDYFDQQFKKALKTKQQNLPHRFLYVGRYIQRKGIKDLWSAFISLCNETSTDWELWCCGTGPLEDEAAEHPQIKHLGFVQPEEMKTIIEDTAVFILPSHEEPWGVVVHEFAAAGFPLLCSDRVGAAVQFLKDGRNGYRFRASDIADLKKKMRLVINKSDTELLEMGQVSSQMAAENTPAIWADKLKKVLLNHH